MLLIDHFLVTRLSYRVDAIGTQPLAVRISSSPLSPWCALFLCWFGIRRLVASRHFFWVDFRFIVASDTSWLSIDTDNIDGFSSWFCIDCTYWGRVSIMWSWSTRFSLNVRFSLDRDYLRLYVSCIHVICWINYTTTSSSWISTLILIIRSRHQVIYVQKSKFSGFFLLFLSYAPSDGSCTCRCRFDVKSFVPMFIRFLYGTMMGGLQFESIIIMIRLQHLAIFQFCITLSFTFVEPCGSNWSVILIRLSILCMAVAFRCCSMLGHSAPALDGFCHFVFSPNRQAMVRALVDAYLMWKFGPPVYLGSSMQIWCVACVPIRSSSWSGYDT